MGRPRSISDDDIARAARACLEEHGPRVATAVIAERLGVSQAALFKRLGTREAILTASLATVAPPTWREALAAGPPAEGAADALEELLVAMYTSLRELLPLLLLLTSAGLPLSELPLPSLRAAPHEARRGLARWLRAARARGALPARPEEDVADVLVAALEARCFREHLGGRAFAPGSAATYVRSLLGAVGLTPPPRERKEKGA